MDARTAASRIVAAVSPGARPRIRAIAPPCELCFVDTAEALLRELDNRRCDMLILGLHFEESTAVAALQRVRARADTFPVVCVRGRPSRLGQRSLSALRMAVSELGTDNFIDLLEYPDDEAGNARVRAMLERLLQDGPLGAARRVRP
jgi:hypothetical protein